VHRGRRSVPALGDERVHQRHAPVQRGAGGRVDGALRRCGQRLRPRRRQRDPALLRRAVRHCRRRALPPGYAGVQRGGLGKLRGGGDTDRGGVRQRPRRGLRRGGGRRLHDRTPLPGPRPRERDRDGGGHRDHGGRGPGPARNLRDGIGGRAGRGAAMGRAERRLLHLHDGGVALRHRALPARRGVQRTGARLQRRHGRRDHVIGDRVALGRAGGGGRRRRGRRASAAATRAGAAAPRAARAAPAGW